MRRVRERFGADRTGVVGEDQRCDILPDDETLRDLALAQDADKKEWISLFNGKDLTGWVNINCAPSTWQVRDGVIVCSGKPTGLLRTEKQEGNTLTIEPSREGGGRNTTLKLIRVE